MDNITLTFSITGTHDGQSYSRTSSYVANVRSVARFSRDLSNSFDAIAVAPWNAFNFILIENTGADDAFVFLGRLSAVCPAGKSIVMTGSTGEDNAGTFTFAPGTTIQARSRTSTGTRINAVIGY